MGTKNLSASRKNVVIKAGTKPLRWAFAKSKIECDPTRGHLLFTDKKKKRKILTPAMPQPFSKLNGKIIWLNLPIC